VKLAQEVKVFCFFFSKKKSSFLGVLSVSRRTLTVAAFVTVVAIMTGITSYSVTLYRLFCQVTGSGGTTQRVAEGSTHQTNRVVTVFFDTSVAPGLPWKFVPVQRSVKLHLGEDSMAFFEAQNISNHDIVGHATFNVTPEKIGVYFKKIQCFCFNEEKLAAGEKVQMPVTFFVDPRLAEDPSTNDVHEITLSYTFFESKRPEGAIDLSRFSSASADAQAGGALFAAQCSGCHALDTSKIGPALGNVVGREAGSVAGYPYSAALKHAHLVWTAETLDRWLANPAAFLPGAQMPMRVDAAAARKDIIAYLQSLPKPAG
jgi:cytochrome c oxidase assembly protein Cox11